MEMPNEGAWSFNNSIIAGGFDSHVREQLPWYDLATGIVTHLIMSYLPDGGLIYDIGASTGNISLAASEVIKARQATVVPIEPSQEMTLKYKGLGDPVLASAEHFDYSEFDISVMFLTMMFVPSNERCDLLKKLYEKCKVGGCIIIFDKRESCGGYISTVLSRLTLSTKLKAGASADNVLKKELSLSGVQRPYTCSHKFSTEVFRFGEFSGWVIEKHGS